MLDRKAKLTVLAFLLLMLASAIWLVGYTGRWSAIPFFLPACVMFVVAIWQWRLARVGGWLLVAYALIVIASALFVPASLIAPLISSMSLASLIVVFIKRRQLHKTWIPR
jgi:hypothetical protein